MHLMLAFLNIRPFLDIRHCLDRCVDRFVLSPRAAAPDGVAPTEHGQASVEYALVLLGAGIVASLVIAWAGKTGSIGELFDSMINLVKGKAQ